MKSFAHRCRWGRASVQGVVAMLLLVFVLSGCESPVTDTNPVTSDPEADSDPPETRSFHMGFTPWPYRADADFNEIFYTYDLIQQYGDIVAYHFQQGIPYPEAYAMRENPAVSNLPESVRNEINLRAGQTDVVDRIYLAIDTTGSGRDDLIGYYGTDFDTDGNSEQQLRPNNSGGTPDIAGYGAIDWSTKSFSDPEIADAFVSYARAMIDELTAKGFDIAYFNYASEISDLLLHDSAEYAQFLIFAERVYTDLKVEYPTLPLMVSVALKHPDSQDAQTIRDDLGNLMDYSDILGISVYPYAFFYPAVADPSELPSDWANQATVLAEGKPVAFTETGWIAEDLSISAYPLNRTSSEAVQTTFVNVLFEEAQELEAEFIIWFSLIDYSYYWTDTLGSDDLSAIWRDSGLLDYDGSSDINHQFDYEAIAATPLSDAGLSERPAAVAWREWLALAQE